MTHREADDFYLTPAEREEERDENLLTASRMFAALSRSPEGAQAVVTAAGVVFAWARHLSAAERAEFAAELTAALSDAAELGIDATPGGDRRMEATARIKADKNLYTQAAAPTEGDSGPVEGLREPAPR